MTSILELGWIGDDATDNSRHCAELAYAIAAGEISTLHFPAGKYRLKSGRLDINGWPASLTITGDGAGASCILNENGAGQYPLVIRNGNDLVLRDIGFVSKTTTYDHTCQILNCSSVLVDGCEFRDATQYGLSISEDILSGTATPMNDITVRNSRFVGCEWYGLMHFPKVISERAQFYNNVFVGCGSNKTLRQFGLIGLFSSMKVGQVTRNVRAFGNQIFCAPMSAGMLIGNYFECDYFDNFILGSEEYGIAASATLHPLASAPTFDSLLIARNHIRFPPGLKRVNPAIAFTSNKNFGRAIIDGNLVEDDTYSSSIRCLPQAGNYIADGIEVTNNRLPGSGQILISGAAGKEATNPLVERNS